MSIPKTLVNCLSIKSGGGRAHLANVLPRLAKNYHDKHPGHFCLLVDQAQQQEFNSFSHCRMLTMEKESLSGIRRVLWERENLGQIVLENEIEVIFTPNQVLATRTSARNVVFLGNMEPFLFHKHKYSWKNWLRNHLLRRASLAAVRRADRVIACSLFVKEHLAGIDGVSPEKLFHVYHGRDVQFAKSGMSGSDLLPFKQPFFLTCGSLLPYRRCEDVLQAFEVFHKTHPNDDHMLVVAGSGNDQRYRDLLNRLAGCSQVRDRIKFLGHVDRSTMSQLYANCSACILATEIEACPITAIEALTSGCAIIASDSPPLPEILGEAAIYYPRRRVEKLAEQMGRLLDQPELANKYRTDATERSKRYDWDTCAQQTFELLASS